MDSTITIALLICVAAVQLYFASILRGYGLKKGEQIARRSDLDALKSELDTNTRLIEGIKDDVEYRSWRKKTSETVRREKLEQYLIKIYAATASMNDEMNHKLFAHNGDYEKHAFNHASMLQKLYLPELREAHTHYVDHWAAFRDWVAEGIELKARVRPGLKWVSDDYIARYGPLYRSTLSAESAIEVVAQRLAESWGDQLRPPY